jgi:hypothetical protein
VNILGPTEADQCEAVRDVALQPYIVANVLPAQVSQLIKRGQRVAPVVVVPEGPAAGGGVWSSAVDPGVPLGPGLGGTRSVFHGPHVRIATARMNAKAIKPNVRKLIEPFRS